MIQLLILFLSVATALLVFTKKYKLIPIYMLFVFLFTIDYANYYLKIDSSLSGYLVKMYTEILFVFTTLYFIASSLKSNKTNKIAFYTLLFLVLTLAIGINKNGALSAILDWKSSILPIALPLLLIYSKIVDSNTIKKLMGFVCLLTLLNTTIALFQYSTFNGDPQSSWRYDFLVNARQNNETENEERFVTYQIVRNDKLRASGIFVSALQYSYLAAFSAFYIFLQILSVKKNKFVLYLGYSTLLLTFILGMLASQVRASFIIFLVAIATYYTCTKRSPTGITLLTKRALTLILVNYSILLLTLFIFGADSLDASAAGRAPQYLKAISEFSIIGAGLGKYRGQFDSDLVYGSLTLGLIFLFIPLLFVTMLRKTSSKQALYSDENAYTVTLAFCIATSVATVSLFQHLSGTVLYYVTWLLLIASATRVSSPIHKPSIAKNKTYKMYHEVNTIVGKARN